MNSAISEGVQIMFIGMGVVATFLILLVFVMMLVSKIASIADKFMPIKEETPAVAVGKIDDSVVAIAIAVAHLQSK